MRHRRWAACLALSLSAAAVATGTGYAMASSGSVDRPLGPGLVTVEVGIEHSRFDIGALEVREGTTVEFIVRNDDPIDHELIVGTPAVHRAHVNGSELSHPPIPGEVSVRPGQVASTFYEFTEAGSIVYACHLPGHVAYGMEGTIEVSPTPG
jgi:uncharacterized cupredoxin-like copper-binding protein